MARPDVRFPGYFPRHAHHRIHLAPGCPYIEVNQLLKATGACDSGGAGKMLVAEGHVSVGGVVEHRKTAKIRAGQIVDIGDLRIVVRDGDGDGDGNDTDDAA